MNRVSIAVVPTGNDPDVGGDVFLHRTVLPALKVMRPLVVMRVLRRADPGRKRITTARR
jgi:hypothetical protein